MKKITLLVAFFALAFTASAQQISIAPQIGYASPTESKGMKGGVAFNIDILYHMDENIAFGIEYSGNGLIGEKTLGETPIMGLGIFGLKGQYRLTGSSIQPYAGLTLGMAALSTPEIKVNGTVVTKSESASKFGIKPELGVYFGKGFHLGASYLLPNTFKKDKVTLAKQGALQIVLGYRFAFGI